MFFCDSLVFIRLTFFIWVSSPSITINIVASFLYSGMIETSLSSDGRIIEEVNDLKAFVDRSEEHTSELQSRQYLVCRLLLEKKKKNLSTHIIGHYITLLV